jgi:hypothetical protein
MAAPVFIDIPADEWKLVAAGVMSGQIWQVQWKRTGGNLLHTYVVAGDPAPAPLTDASLGVPFDERQVQIKSSAAIDVYVHSVGTASRVRVDL